MKQRIAILFGACVALPLSSRLCAQSVAIPLNYNFNGIVDAGEALQPDNPIGYRSISDRGLDFSSGIPNDALLNKYTLVNTPGALDIVHLGNRNTVDNGNWAFDVIADGDNVGIQPTWLANVNQTGPQTTTLPAPALIGLTSAASFLFQISNGGGSFDVVFRYVSGRSRTATLSGVDWFGGNLPGRDRVDLAGAGANLNVTEQTVDLSGDAGESLLSITFQNRTNLQAGYAILGANVEVAPTPRRSNQIALNYNWNGIVHAGESGAPDAPNGYRSISDRGLDFQAGVPAHPLLQPFRLVATAGTLDLVHLGNRNTVDNGTHPFDAVPDGDDVGVQPAWLPAVDQTGPQTTTLASPILLDGASTASFLFLISNGGGSFDARFTLRGGASITATLSGGDWFGGPFAGATRIDQGIAGGSLGIVQQTVDLSAAAGLVLEAITFENPSNPIAGHAILAADVSGCLACANGAAVIDRGGGNGPLMSTTSTGNLGCPLAWSVAAATPGTLLGFVAIGFGDSPLPLSLLFAPCAGTIHVPQPVPVAVSVDGTGAASLVVPGLLQSSWCGVAITAQFAEIVNAACPIRMSNAITIAIGN